MIDLKKTYKTRDGRPVRLISDRGHPVFPIVGYIENASVPYTWTYEGCSFQNRTQSSIDLIEVAPEPSKTKVSVWMNIYPYAGYSVWKTREQADNHRYDDRIACKYIEFEVEEGEGL